MIIHLSDLHIGLSPQETENTRRIFGWIIDNHPGIPVLITGDLTDSAEEIQLKDVGDMIEFLSYANRVIVVPGNHDYAWYGNICLDEGWEHWREYLGDRFGGDKEILDGLKITEIGTTTIFSVDSGDPTDKEISARGYISEALTGSLRKALTDSWAETRVVLLHHHPFDSGFFTKLHGSEIFMNALSGNCEIVLFGHEHRYGTWLGYHNIPLITASHKSTDRFGECLFVGLIEGAECNLIPIPIGGNHG